MLEELAQVHRLNGITLYFIPKARTLGDDARLPSLQLPAPLDDLFLSPDTRFGDVVIAAGIKVYDFAMPQDWLQQHYWDKGQPTPRGVWSYDDNPIFGAFVGLPDMLKKIAEQISATSAEAAPPAP